MDLGKLSQMGQKRECGICGEVFLTDASKEGLTAYQKFADHTAVHNPDGSAWSEAYHRIQAAKEKK